MKTFRIYTQDGSEEEIQFASLEVRLALAFASLATKPEVTQ